MPKTTRATPVRFLANNWVIAHARTITIPVPGIRLHRNFIRPSANIRRLYPAVAARVVGPGLPHHDDRPEQPVTNSVGSLGLMALVVLMAFLACTFRH